MHKLPSDFSLAEVLKETGNAGISIGVLPLGALCSSRKPTGGARKGLSGLDKNFKFYFMDPRNLKASKFNVKLHLHKAMYLQAYIYKRSFRLCTESNGCMDGCIQTYINML